MIFLDTETCGYHGLAILIQYAEGEGDIHLHNVWQEPISDTLELLRQLANSEICGFNLAFDWFHIHKLYAIFSNIPDQSIVPRECIDYIAVMEEKSRRYPICLKPVSALDLFLHARKGSFQSLMERRDIIIKRVPTCLAEFLLAELEQRIQLDNIYFARRKSSSTARWAIEDVTDPDGKYNPSFKNLVLRFAPSMALKVFAKHILKYESIHTFADIEISSKLRPIEYGYAPFAMAVGNPNNWQGAWPSVIRHHIDHWTYFQPARKYARDDIELTRKLWHYFKCPQPGDDDSVLACMVGAVRWYGFKINTTKLTQQKIKAEKRRQLAPEAPNRVKIYLREVMDETEQIVLHDGTGVKVLKTIAGKYEKVDGEDTWVWGWTVDCLCDSSKCSKCNGTGLQPHLAAVRAKEVLDARHAGKEVQLYKKLLIADRFHASFKVIGTLSGRMSGADGLNPQGINKTGDVRSCFELADDDYVLCGGDFKSFEVAISEAVYHDPQLRKDLMSGQKIHAIFATILFDMSYEDVMKTEGTENDRYADGKRAVFGLNYGGDENTLVNRIEDVTIDRAKMAFDRFMKRYPGVGKARQRIHDMFCSMRQPGGVGSAVEWHEPVDCIEAPPGYTRFFTLENRVCKALFDLAQQPPKAWRSLTFKVQRRERLQTPSGAVQSALYGAAFAIQGSNMRAAANHEIQSKGAGITKGVQRSIWDIQPSGEAEWRVLPINAHDEIMCPTKPEYVDAVTIAVAEKVESYLPVVPLLSMDWTSGLETWADK